jgi:hypothetical protein
VAQFTPSSKNLAECENRRVRINQVPSNLNRMRRMSPAVRHQLADFAETRQSF